MLKIFQNIERFPRDIKGMSAFKIWRIYLARLQPVYIIGFLAVVATNLSQVLEPKVLQWAIESFENNQPNLVYYTSLLLGVYLFQVLSRFLWRISIAQQSHVAAAAMKSRLWDHVRFLPLYRTQRDLNVGELMNVATGDINHAKFVFGFTLVGSIDFLFMILLTSITMLMIDVQLTLLSLIVIPLLPVLVYRIAKKEEKLHRESQEELSFLSDEIAQAVSTVRLQKLTLSQRFWLRRLCQAARKYQGRRWKLLKTDLSFIPTTGFAPVISVAILMGLSIPRLMEGSLSLGAFVALNSMMYMIADPLMEMGWIVSDWQLSLTSLKRFSFVLNQEVEKQLKKKTHPQKVKDYSLEVRNLSFQYPLSERQILKGVDLNISPGQRIGVKGDVGSGKSTFLEVVAGFHPLYSGEIRISGVDIRSFPKSQLRELVGFVPQRPFLFADTIAQNISVNRNLSESEIWKYLELAALKEDVEAFPKALETSLGEWGVNLSGGQKQRLTIARTLAAQPKLLFLDDCLSAVDTLTEEKILKNLDQHFGEATVLWAAHRDSTLKYCHRVVEL